MDGERFDDLVRLLGRPLPRRGAVRLVVAGLALAAAAGSMPRAVATAVCPERVPRPGHRPAHNGCGPEGGLFSIPQGWRDTSFRRACNAHDVCYETCNADRRRCDDRFLKDLYAACNDAYPPKRERRLNDRCRSRACLYYEAVSLLGGEVYEAAQDEACVCCNTATTGSKCGDVCCATTQFCTDDGRCKDLAW